jgi:cell division cycle 2-like protein
MSSTTTSHKRSKWHPDEGEEEQTFQQRAKPTTKRQKVNRSTTSPSDHVAIPSRSASNTPTQSRPSHSIYVPPRTQHPPILPARSVYCYERLNQIEEGSYGVVFRARDKQTGDIVALKKLKLDEEKHGFPITALREINALMSCRHENVVRIREVVVGDTLTQYVCSQAILSANQRCAQGIRCDGFHRA